MPLLCHNENAESRSEKSDAVTNVVYMDKNFEHHCAIGILRGVN